MNDPESIKQQIKSAFADVTYPGDWCLRRSNEGEEPYLLKEEFKGKRDRYALAPAFLDRAPDGYSSALGFFSDEAFRFYLPAYLIADLDGLLERATPLFHLTHGLNDQSRRQFISPGRYGVRTWFEEATHRLSVFDRAQAAAIVAYLRYKAEHDDYVRDEVAQALKNFWLSRSISGPTADPEPVVEAPRSASTALPTESHMAIISSSCSSEGSNDQADKIAEWFSPSQVDQMIRHGIQTCWMALPKERRTADELEKQIRRIVDRALANFREDQDAFGRTKV